MLTGRRRQNTPDTKVRVVGTFERRLCKEMEFIHMEEIEVAKTEDQVQLSWSSTLEMLLFKGFRSYKIDRKRQLFKTVAG